LMARIDALLNKGFALLKFPAALEDQFLRDTLEARRRHFLISGMLALVLYNGFLIVDYLMAPDVFELAVRLRLLYLTPIGLFLIFLGTRTNWRIVRMMPPMAYEAIIVAIGLFAAMTLAFILSETKGRLVWPIVTLVGATALFSLVANYTMEHDERRRYLLTMRERGVVRELSQTYERLQALSHVDGLTGLYNRRHFQEHLENVWGRAQYDKELVSMLMIDIDQFKRYNDRYGHPAGDECLQQIAQVLQNTLRRPEDLIARYGGEEFIALMPHADQQQAMQAAERVRQAVEALEIRHESSTASRFVTVSIGVACVRADFALKDAVLISAADHALQQAKREGRNRIGMHDMPATSPQPVS